jgi:hypothetical protein
LAATVENDHDNRPRPPHQTSAVTTKPAFGCGVVGVADDFRDRSRQSRPIITTRMAETSLNRYPPRLTVEELRNGESLRAPLWTALPEWSLGRRTARVFGQDSE